MAFYGVWKGKIPGIYQSWEDCKKQIYGFNGQRFKKLESKTYEDALIEYQKGYIAKNTPVKLTDEQRKEKNNQKREKNLAKLERKKANKEAYKQKRLAEKEAHKQQRLAEKETFEKKYGKITGRIKSGKLPIHQVFENPENPPLNAVIPFISRERGFFTFKIISYPSGNILFDSNKSDLKDCRGGSNHIWDLIALTLTLKYLMNNNLPLRVFTNSKTLLSWYTNIKINASEDVLSTLSPEMQALLDRSLSFLESNQELLQSAEVMEWSVKKWGKLPATIYTQLNNYYSNPDLS